MPQVKMIFPQQHIANIIACKLSKHNELEYVVEKVMAGFEVRPQNAPPPNSMTTIQPKLNLTKTWTQSNAVELAFRFKQESPVYLDVWLDNGKVTSFGKSAVISWEVYKQVTGNDWEMRVRITMPVAYAKRRGFITG